jgi:hypothetical protein
VLAAAWAVLAVVLVMNSSVWQTAISDAQQSGEFVGDVDTAISLVKTTSIAVAVIFAGLFLFFAFKMRAGRNWARITLTVLAGLSVLQAFGLRSRVTVNNRVYETQHVWQGLIGGALSLAAIVLMYLAVSNRYFATMKARQYR